MGNDKIISYAPYLNDINEYKLCIDDIFATGFLSNGGKFYDKFREAIIKHTGNDNVVLSSSADIGLLSTAITMVNKYGNRVGMNGFTFNSTINSFTLAGADITLIDANFDNCNVCFEDLKRVVDKGIDVLVLTHVYGNVIDIDRVKEIFGGPIVWDAAQAYGASYKGIPIGSHGDVEIFSFSPTKVLTSGEGGAICASDPEILGEIELRLRYGFHLDYVSKFPGVNGKLSEPNAALGYVNHKFLYENLAHRKSQYYHYKDNLSGGDIRWPVIGFDSTHKDISILMEDKTKTVAALKKASIPFKEYFIPPSRYEYINAEPLPNIQKIYESVINLPVGPRVTEEHIDTICNIINNV